MGTFFVPKTSIQRIPEKPVVDRKTSGIPVAFYTCPAGKKAIFEGYIVCFNTGAAATAFVRSPDGTFNLATWSATGGTTDLLDDLAEGVPFRTRIELEAGETITVDQSLGSNAEFEINGTVKELPA